MDWNHHHGRRKQCDGCQKCVQRCHHRWNWAHHLLKEAHLFSPKQSNFKVLRGALTDLQVTPLIKHCINENVEKVKTALAQNPDPEQDKGSFTDGEVKFTFKALAYVSAVYVEQFNSKRADKLYDIALALLEAGCDVDSSMTMDYIDYKGKVWRKGCTFNSLALLTLQYVHFEARYFHPHAPRVKMPRLGVALLAHGCRIPRELHILETFTQLKYFNMKNPFMQMLRVGGLCYFGCLTEEKGTIDLHCICREQLRKTLINSGERNIFVLIESLPLPDRIKTYLLYEIDWSKLKEETAITTPSFH